jgi:hypothetical protein
MFRDLAYAEIDADQDRHLHQLAAYLGLRAPMLLKNAITKRQLSIKRLSRCARSVADLHQIRHVDRNRIPQGQRRNRYQSLRCRRIRPHHG